MCEDYAISVYRGYEELITLGSLINYAFRLKCSLFVEQMGLIFVDLIFC